MDDFEKELRQGFLTEAEQSLVDVEQCFLDLESNPNDADNLNKIFRLAHNLKGSSKAVGFDEMGALTHEFETFILKIKNGELPASAPVVSFLLRCNDFLRNMVSGLQADLDAKFDIAVWIQEMLDLSSGGGAEASPAPEAEEPVVEDVPQESEVAAAAVSMPAPLVEGGVELEPNMELLAELGALGLTADIPARAPAAPAPKIETPKPAAVAEAKAPSDSKSKVPEQVLSVALSKVEGLLNAVGEMTILQSVLREQAEKANSELLRKTVQQLSKVGKEIQDMSMSLRMIAVKPTFQKMQRIVRDTSKALNKDVTIVLAGEDAEIDKTVLEKINDPLVHLVRNSVDHGIEPLDVRRAAGKPDKGSVHLSAFHEGGRFVIEVADDGGGLNPAKLMKKAIEKKLISPTAQLSDQEAYNLIFAPGFSTKEQVTDVSGRGVGMDVVKTNIQALGGEIQILSEIGKGSTFRILLPLTLAIIDGMIVKVGEQRFVVPMAHIHETLQPTEKQIQQTQLGEILMLRGENLPLHRLGDFFGLKAEKPAHQQISCIVRSGSKNFGLLVDDIVSQVQVVVKSLGHELDDYRGVGGTTILGDGKPAFILEPPDLFKRGSRATKSAPPSSSSNKKMGVAA